MSLQHGKAMSLPFMREIKYGANIQKQTKFSSKKIFFQIVIFVFFDNRELLKTRNSRLATKTKAQFTVVNKHIVEGA